jgi:dynein heavy chain
MPKGGANRGYGAPGSRHGSLKIGGQAEMFQFNAHDLDQYKFKPQPGSSRLPGMSRNFQENDDSQDVAVDSFEFLKGTFGPRGKVEPVQPPIEDTGVDSAILLEAPKDAAQGLAEDDEEFPRLETGEGAISFFAQNRGGNSQVKFVHLIREKTDIDFRPYDLTVVPPEECEAGGSFSGDYYTMSAAGLVHVQPGQPSDFTPLTEWMRQSTLFSMLRSIRFYKYYLHTKCFQLWHNNVRYKMYCQQRSKVGHKLFMAKASFCVPLLKLKDEMLEMQSVMLLDVGNKTFEVANFVEHQAQKRTDASKRFEIIMEKVQSIVQGVCSDVANLARAKEGGDSPLDLALNSKLVSSSHKSIVAIKQEETERKKLLRRASEEAAMLKDFIRLADYVGVGSLVQLTVRTLADFYAELLKPRKAGLFETTVQFVEEGTVFHPTCNDIQGIMGSMSDAMISSVSGVNRIVYNRPFTEHVSRVISDPPNVGEIIRSSVHFNRVRQSIDAKINEDFADAQSYVVEFDRVRPIYEHNRDWDMGSYKRRDHTMKSLKEELEKISAWEKELDRMKARQICGILEVETRRLKAILSPLTTEKLDALKTLVKDLARGKCKELLNKYRNRISKLSQRPVHLKDFANQTEQVASVLADEKTLFKHTGMVENMYQLLSAYDVEVPSEDSVQLDDLRGYQHSYQENVEAAQSFKSERMPEMTAQLDMKIAGLNERLVAITAELQAGEYVNDAHFDDPTPVLDELQHVKQQLDVIDQHCKQYSSQQQLFGITVYNYKNQATAMENFDKQAQLWSMISQWNDKFNEWMTSDFIDPDSGEVNIDVEEANKDVQIYVKESFGLHKKLTNSVSAKLKERTAEFKAKMPVVLELGNPSMKDRHWEKLFQDLNQTYSSGAPFTLKEMLDYGVLDHADAVSEQSATATGEAQLEGTLEAIREGWDKANFTLNNHRDQEDVYVLGALDEIFLLLEDNQVTLQTMLGSRYIAGVHAEVEEWEKKLALLSDTLDEWTACQKSWMYLETIFGAPDIQKQLPVEAQKFLLVDKSWKSTLKACSDNSKVIASIDDGDRLLKEFEYCVETLDQIQKSLEDYLQTKRMAFPRFYFLPNEDLIEILSQTRDPQAVQPHVGKCFDAIKRLQFGEKREAHNIKGFYDPKTEFVPSSEDVLAEGPVETWLKSFEACMVKTLYDRNKLAWQQYPADGQPAIERKDWLFSAPAQIIIVVDEIVWTRNMARALNAMDNGSNPNATKEFWEFSVKQIEYMIGLVQGDLNRGQRTMIGALVTIDVHAREVTADIVAKGVSSARDFMWTKQLRYYWEEEIDDCTAKQTNTRFVYGYEYLGNGPRLVITPLTDKCYMTLTGALHMKLGGAPAGPAGTGKTETTKDLAKALAVFCVVFNCSDGLDYKMMGTFFSGLAQQGAWACFDEFNRIDIEVLSVIAQQILSIQQALFAEMAEFNFEDNLIPLSPGFGVFITMNPGYAGRTELPDNLQALFRPVAMMVPDYRLIAEIILYSEGFVDAVPLSNKMQQLYALSSEQLSKQDHYDFGMRAVKSVLVCAGLLKRKEPEANENLLLIRAMRDSNTPKFLEMDLPLFGGILTDLFPGVNVPFVDYGKLQSCIENQLIARNLQCVPSFIAKIIQVRTFQLSIVVSNSLKQLAPS